MTLRLVYTPTQFAEEVLGGNRTPKWVRQQIRIKRIKAQIGRPHLIPRSEAERFTGTKEAV